MKKLLPGQLRFGIKKIDKAYRVYDFAKANFPYSSSELGTVLQDLPEAEIQAEVDRLNAEWIAKTAPKSSSKPVKPVKSKSSDAESIQADDLEDELPVFTPAEEITEDEIESYGELTEEQRQKMEASLGL